MTGTGVGTLYRHTGVALLRAAVLAADQEPSWWPDPGDDIGCRAWLAQVWSRPEYVAGIEHASPTLAERVAAVLAGQPADSRRVSRAALSTTRYLLRATGRPTPFGLFAGVAPARVAVGTQVRWGGGDQPVVRADTQWLADVIDQLEAFPTLLGRLDVVVTSLATRRGDRLDAPRPGGWVSIGYSPAIRAVCELAANPVRFGELAERLAVALPGGSRPAAEVMLTTLLRHGLLISELRAPFTMTDPLGYLLDRLGAAHAGDLTESGTLVRELAAVRGELEQHNRSAGAGQRAARVAVGARMRRLSAAGRTPLAVDVRLDAEVQVPALIVTEVEHAASALLRLTRHPAGLPAWIGYHAAFRDRYGVGTLVPLREALDADAGLGYPAGYPGSILTAPTTADPDVVQRRDGRLLALAWASRDRAEVTLTDADLQQLADDVGGLDEGWIPPHVELAARVCAVSTEAVDRGEFTLLVAPARAGGTLTSRFTVTATGDGLQPVYRDLPVAAAGAEPVQLSFPPAYPHAENVCRVPPYLPRVLSLGEHRPHDGSASYPAGAGRSTLLPVEDLALTATADRLHLVDLADGRIIEPQVFHALALDKQAPPLARFLAHLPRAWSPAWTVFDWGPHADALPYLPAVRYRRCILTPRRWRLTTDDLTGDPLTGHGRKVDAAGEDESWQQKLRGWRRRCGCAEVVDLREDDRSLRLTLEEPMHAAILKAHLDRHGSAVLTDSVAGPQAGWIGGHAHEIAVPLVRACPSAAIPPTAATGTMAKASAGARASTVLTNRSHRQLPGGSDSRWLSARLSAHPDRHDGIIAVHLPGLADELAELHGAGAHWFIRYRSPREADHLRVRIRLPHAGQFAACGGVVGRWAERLCDQGLAGDLTFDSYQPEIGRYGPGAAMTAAEEVFSADSRAVAVNLRLLPSSVIDRTALTAAGMVGVVCGLLGERAGLDWLVSRPAAPAGSNRSIPPLPPGAASTNRTVTDQAVRAVRAADPELLGWPAEVAAAWRARTDALAAYAHSLSGEPAAVSDSVVESLTHMHHNRAVGIDPAHEARCRRLARQVAVATRAWPVRPPVREGR